MSTTTKIDHESFNELLLAIIDKLQKQDFDLPSLPHTASRILALTSDSNADAVQLTELLQQNPILTAKTFKTSNSAAWAATKKSESLSHAVAWLGLPTVAGTAYALYLKSEVFDIRGYEQEVQGLWTHALAAGFYAKSIADHIEQDANTAFLCGLLHGIGKQLVVHTVNEYQKNSSERIPWTIMLALFKESSMEVGRRIAITWKFPDSVKKAINLYEDHAFYLDTSTTKSASITNLAHHLATHCVDPQTTSEDTLRSLPVIQALNIQESTMDVLLQLHGPIRTQIKTILS